MSTNTPIASQTLTSNTSSVTFSNIPQTYTDLVLILGNINVTDAAQNLLQFNSDTGSNYSRTALSGNGSSATSGQNSNQTALMLETTFYPSFNGNKDYTGIWNIMNYSNTTTNKTVIGRGSSASVGTGTSVGLWRSTSAITSIKIEAAYGYLYSSGSTFNLYGISAGSSKAFGGNTVTTDGTYWYHTFTSSGTFTPAQSLTADYLVVAGGGGGGNGGTGEGGGGGGAGGYRSSLSGGSALSLTGNTLYTVTIGAGGAKGTGELPGSQGGNSVFSTITSSGGGFGGGWNGAQVAGNGGSGGGRQGGNYGGSAGTGNSGGYTPSEGNNGGTGENTGLAKGGGGGGGASAAGSAGSGQNGGAGGSGTANSISGSSVTYAGGGGGAGGSSGGAGGAGGGAAGLSNTNATANTGGGGGAGYNQANSSNGGSGIVIVRYAV